MQLSCNTHQLRTRVGNYASRCSVIAAALILACPVAVNDMFFDLPYNLDAVDARCFALYGIHVQFNWAAAK